MRFEGVNHAAHLDTGGSSRSLRVEAPLHLILSEQIEMSREILVEIPVQTAPSDECTDP
jgi:hypothetical protein